MTEKGSRAWAGNVDRRTQWPAGCAWCNPVDRTARSWDNSEKRFRGQRLSSAHKLGTQTICNPTIVQIKSEFGLKVIQNVLRLSGETFVIFRLVIKYKYWMVYFWAVAISRCADRGCYRASCSSAGHHLVESYHTMWLLSCWDVKVENSVVDLRWSLFLNSFMIGAGLKFEIMLMVFNLIRKSYYL